MRKVVTFNASKFLELAREARDEAAALVGTNPYIATYRDALRFVLDEDDYTDVEYVQDARTAQNLHDELFVASQAAYTNGATADQIDTIVALCAAKGDFERTGYTVLTRGQAKMLISDLKR